MNYDDFLDFRFYKNIGLL